MKSTSYIRQQVDAFLSRYGFTRESCGMRTVVSALLYDMEQALAHATGYEAGGHIKDGVQAMLPVWTLPPEHMPRNKKVIVIDAGGTNFRSCLVSFDTDGVPIISDMQKTAMPAIDREYSKAEFFDAIAANLDHLKDKASVIGFCFSYSMEILPDGDGKIVEFSKEIKAEEVVGSHMGKCLAEALRARGWTAIDHIAMLNDTTAALLAGSVCGGSSKRYDSYVGFILGTGMNCAYIESKPIGKIAHSYEQIPASQIVVNEIGSFDRLPMSDFDKELDAASQRPGRFIMEKMCSGGYLGLLATIIIRHAIAESLFSDGFAGAFGKLEKEQGGFSLYDMDRFMYTPFDDTTLLGAIVSKGTAEDYETMYYILDAVIQRSACLAAGCIAAAVIKSGKGTNPLHPVCVVCNGTTFHKTYGLKDRVSAYLRQFLTEEQGLYYELVSVDNDITLGSAAAAV
ncbi:MAG: hexokinase [Treponema sp.]|nr:hexokinase [Treponema sp.]